MEKNAAQSAETPLETATAEALRAIDEVRDLLETATSDDLAERAETVREKLDAAREKLEPRLEALRRAERSVREDLDEAEAWIRENPLRATLTAGGVGLLLGLLLSRRR